MSKLLKILSSLSLALILGCSTQTRTAGEQASLTELNEIIASMNSGLDVSGSSGNKGEIGESSNSAYTLAYYAREQEGRPAVSVFGVFDLEPLIPKYATGVSTQDIDVKKVDAIFIDNEVEGQRTFSLLIRYELKQEGSCAEESCWEPYIIGQSRANSHTFTKDFFEVPIQIQGGSEIIVRVNDLSEKFNNELGGAIKLNLFIVENGRRFSIGHISTMRGYGYR